MANKKRRKINYARLVLLILIAIALIAVIVLGIQYILKDDSDTSKSNTTTPSVITNSDTKIELNDYSVYEDKNSDLGFNFVVANLKFSNDNGISYDLANLKTSEGIVLSQISDYQKQITMASYNFDSLNTTTSVQSSDKQTSVKVLIPYKESNSLSLIDTVSNASILIDTTKNKVDIDTLKKQDNTQDIISNDYNISVANSYITSNMYHNGERYDSPYNTYVFEMTVNSISNNVKITSASFKQTSTGEVFDAMDSSYTTSISGNKMDNILDKTLKANDTYALLFDVMANLEEKPDYKGTITINFSDGTSSTIDTELN